MIEGKHWGAAACALCQTSVHTCVHGCAFGNAESLTRVTPQGRNTCLVAQGPGHYFQYSRNQNKNNLLTWKLNNLWKNPGPLWYDFTITYTSHLISSHVKNGSWETAWLWFSRDAILLSSCLRNFYLYFKQFNLKSLSCCVYTCVTHACVSTRMWRPEVNTECLP